MFKIISIHSFRRGTGKTNLVANIAAVLAAGGRRVAVLDTDLQSPGIHNLFGLDADAVPYALNDYLWGQCDIEQAAFDVTPNLGVAVAGQILLVPARPDLEAIARVLQEGYDVSLLHDGCQRLSAKLGLDVLLVDTHAGLNEETLTAMAVSDAMAVVLRPDLQDYQGTALVVDVARRLEVERVLLVVNKVVHFFDFERVGQEVAATYGCEVAAVLPLSDEIVALTSSSVFALCYPDDPITASIRRVAELLVA